MRNTKLDQLKSARRRKGWTLRDLAEATGLSRQSLSNYERGKHPPSADHWLKLKRILSLKGSAEEYFGRVGRTGAERIYQKGDACKVEGCKRAPISRGYCRRHYQRWRYRKLSHEAKETTSKARKNRK